MCLVYEPESTSFWHNNELFLSYSRSFHDCSWLPHNSLTDCVREKREGEWLAVAPQLCVLSVQFYVTLVIMKISLPKKGVSSTGHVSSSALICQAKNDGNGP